MTDITQELPVAAERPPPRTHGPAAWLRANLFNSVFNTILTLLALYLLAVTIPAVIRWGLVDAIWTAPNGQACHGDGACWAFIAEKARFIVFGRFPYTEHWRPLFVVLIFVGLILAGNFERRPNASRIANGNAKAMPTTDRINVSGNPLHKAVST